MHRADPFYRGVVWMSVCCDCFVLSGGGLCDGLITCAEESYEYLSVVCVVFCEVKVVQWADHLFRGVVWMFGLLCVLCVGR